MDSLHRNSPSYSLRTRDDRNVAAKWSGTELPSDLLGSISDRLGIIELLRFRCVCKSWCSASSSSSAQIESSRFPWFLLYGETSRCLLISTDSGKIYTVNVPELGDGATCVASDMGWLLVIKNHSIFFYCPFSGSKLQLPGLPINDNWNYIAVFSSPPTSPDSTVFFFGQDISSDHIELHVLARGATSWTKEDFDETNKTTHFKTIRGATLIEDEIYLLNETDGLITYDVNTQEVRVYQIVPRDSAYKNTWKLPFHLGKNYLNWKKMAKLVGLSGNYSLRSCGTRIARQKDEVVVYGEAITCDSVGWIDEEEQIRGRRRHFKGVWLHPRFFKVSPCYQW